MITRHRIEPMVFVIDYGLGNLGSLANFLNRLSLNHKTISNSDNEVKSLVRCNDVLILPGVGSFKAGMANLKERGLDKFIVNHCAEGGCLIGICLGMQLLFEIGTEGGDCKGLGIISGVVQRISSDDGRIPHVGWTQTTPTAQAQSHYKNQLSSPFYYVHSYAAAVSCPQHQIATFSYGQTDYTAAVSKDNTVAFQFHPEKSQDSGLILVESVVNFLGK